MPVLKRVLKSATYSYLRFNCGYMYERNNFGNYRKLVMATHETHISQVYG
ncbi:hypothetical protein QUB17_28235 [Microcoleus sp. B5-C4]